MALLVRPVLLVQQVIQALKESLELPQILGQQVPQEKPALLVLLVPLAKLALKESLELPQILAQRVSQVPQAP
jgi:hypothetical protein